MRQTYTIKWRDGTEQRPGIPTPIDGLALVDLGGDCGYSLTHVRSGLAIVYAPSPEPLAMAARELEGIDWTQPGDELTSTVEAVEAFRRARCCPGVDDYSRKGDPSDIEAAP